MTAHAHITSLEKLSQILREHRPVQQADAEEALKAVRELNRLPQSERAPHEQTLRDLRRAVGRYL